MDSNSILNKRQDVKTKKVVNVKVVDFFGDVTADKESAEITFDCPSYSASKMVSASYVCAAARQRGANARVKRMSELSGTTAKPWNQKGSGRARQGSRRSVQFVGGRTCHGPSGANFAYSLPKKIIKSSINDAIKFKIISDNVSLFHGIDNIDKSRELKTTEVKSALIAAGYSKPTLIITKSHLIKKAAKNIKDIFVESPSSIKIFNILKFSNLLIDKNDIASEKIFEFLSIK